MSGETVKPDDMFYEEGEFYVIIDFRELVRGDRIRANTPPEINEAIDREIAATVRFYAGKTDYEISKRIEELNNEWDIGRHVETRAAIISMVGLLLGLKWGRKWFILPLITTTFLLQYTLIGWAPPIPFLRKFGIRTKQEIGVEKYALKALRGDFDDISSQENRTESVARAFNESKSV